MITIMISKVKYVIAVGYAPTQSCTNAVVARKAFFETGSAMLARFSPSMKKIVLGNFNSHVGLDHDEDEKVGRKRHTTETPPRSFQLMDFLEDSELSLIDSYIQCTYSSSSTAYWIT